MIPLNTQLPEKQEARPLLLGDASLEVVHVWKTIQGEGPFAGWPAVFVRLAGCNLQCPICDTDYTSKRKRYLPCDLQHTIRGLLGTAKLVVLTGGEPFRQYGIADLVRLLVEDKTSVQIETNGTLDIEDFPYGLVTLVCSPKTSAVHPAIETQARHWKYVVEAGFVDPEDGLPLRVLGKNCRVARPPLPFRNNKIYVQPADTGDGAANARNMSVAADSCLKFGYRMSLQTHKILGLE